MSVGPKFDIFPFKQVIMQELGRLEDPDLIRKVAGEICKHELYTMEAVKHIRQVRAWGKPAGNLNLAYAIRNIIEEYRLKPYGVNDDMIRESLNMVLKEFP